MDSAQTVCVLCGQEEGHSPRCSVTRHGADESMFRSTLGAVGPGTPHARMEATWERMHEDEDEVERLTDYSPVASKYPIEYAYVDAFRALKAERDRYCDGIEIALPALEGYLRGESGLPFSDHYRAARTAAEALRAALDQQHLSTEDR
jgi:hypothetical protein